MKTILYSVFISIALCGCVRPCDKVLHLGELVQIPIHFDGFTLREIDGILVYRIDKSDSASIDTFNIQQILWGNWAQSNNEIITDNSPNTYYGYYESYFDNCHLVFNWDSGSDTLADFVVKKSREEGTRCHKNDPNIRIDKLSFVHKEQTITKNQEIRIVK